jgi:hypothetical protein
MDTSSLDLAKNWRLSEVIISIAGRCEVVQDLALEVDVSLWHSERKFPSDCATVHLWALLSMGVLGRECSLHRGSFQCG